MTDLTGLWRLSGGAPLFRITHESEDFSRFSFRRTDGDAKSFFGHGVIQGKEILISWRSTINWLGHGSAESQRLEEDLITGKPIEIHWKGGMPTWQTLTN